MNIPVGRGRPPVSEQPSRDMQALAVHDCVRGVRVAQIMQPRIRHNPRRIARLPPEPVEFILAQRPASLVAAKHPFPAHRLGEAFQQLPRRLAEQNVPRSRLRVNQGQAVGLDLVPTQAAYLARPATCQQKQAHRRDAGRAFAFALAQDRAESRKVVRTEQPPARRSPIADDALARVPRSFGPMAPRDGAVEHVAQYLMTAVRAAQLSASVFAEEAGNVSADDRADAQMAESGQDGAVEVAQGRLHRGRLPRRRAPLDVFGGELRQRRAGSGKGHGTPAALLAREEGERDGPRLVGLHRFRLAERDAARLAVAAEAKYPGPCAVWLDAQHEALQGGIVDGVFAFAWPGREREGIDQAGALQSSVRLAAIEYVGKSARDTRFAASNTEPSARCA